MSKQMKFSCPNCDSEKIAIEKRPGGWFHCQDCHYSWQPYPVKFGFDAPPRKQTVFETITTSPEVLADNLVYYLPEIDKFTSEIIPDFYKARTEAIVATVERLKEVEK